MKKRKIDILPFVVIMQIGLIIAKFFELTEMGWILILSPIWGSIAISLLIVLLLISLDILKK